MSRRLYTAIYLCNAMLLAACAAPAPSAKIEADAPQIVTIFAVNGLSATATAHKANTGVTPTLIPASQPVKVAEEVAIPRQTIGDVEATRPAPTTSPHPEPTPTQLPPTAPVPHPTAVPPVAAMVATIRPNTPTPKSPIEPTRTATPSARATATAPTTPFPKLINRNEWVFTVTPKQPQEGGTVTIAWDVKGENNFDIWVISLGSNAKTQSIASGVRLPSVGTLTYTLPSGRKFSRFSLTARDQVGFSFPDIIIEAKCTQPAQADGGCQREAAIAAQLLAPFATK